MLDIFEKKDGRLEPGFLIATSFNGKPGGKIWVYDFNFAWLRKRKESVILDNLEGEKWAGLFQSVQYRRAMRERYDKLWDPLDSPSPHLYLPYRYEEFNSVDFEGGSFLALREKRKNRMRKLQLSTNARDTVRFCSERSLEEGLTESMRSIQLPDAPKERILELMLEKLK